MRTIPLQRRLRAQRSQHHVTLAQVAATCRIKVTDLAELEFGDAIQCRRVAQNPILVALLARAYGMEHAALAQWLAEEQEWRLCAGDGNLEVLPLVAQMLYRPFPEAVRNLLAQGFVLVDLETTGSRPHEGTTRIVEITAINYKGETLLDTLVNPGIPIPVETSAIHGISDLMVQDAPRFEDLAPQIAEILDGQIVVAYNALFDVSILDRLFIQQQQVPMPTFDVWCLMREYAAFFQGPNRYGKPGGWQTLADAGHQQGVHQEEAGHRARVDTLFTLELLRKCAENPVTYAQQRSLNGGDDEHNTHSVSNA